MAFSSPLLVIVIIIATFLLATLGLAATITPPNRPFKKIYVFGDSYTDTGNTNSATGPSSFNFVSNPPYGMTFFHRPTNRYSDGRIMIDFVSQVLGLPFIPPYLDRKANKSHGVNFAVAGASAIRHSFYVKNNMSLNITPQSLETEIRWFDKFLESQGCKGWNETPKQCGEAFEDALFWIGEMGENDYSYTYISSVDKLKVQKLVIKSLTTFLQTILSKGAKYVVVQGLPTTGCLPFALFLSSDDDRDAIGCSSSFNKQSYEHNRLLQSKLAYLRNQFPDAVIVYSDFWNSFREVVTSPEKYGFVERFKACCGPGADPYNFEMFFPCGSPNTSACGNPYQYINWDGAHLTEGMNKVLANLMLDGTFSYPPFQTLLKKKGEQSLRT
ncbi:GDSL esterase/lipase At3g48460-like [Impatiens glandulifera]|uniref:GDSL esterase/lipase At3g48460-like n=1 Tax=Impatiens glandulifera TaxID=253017 RepID=UPI001FB136B0|nr:GDSL esterase/lipase At3g48460-like [Impatiens glandulifera]